MSDRLGFDMWRESGDDALWFPHEHMPYDDDYDFVMRPAPATETPEPFPHHHMPYDDEHEVERSTDGKDASEPRGRHFWYSGV